MKRWTENVGKKRPKNEGKNMPCDSIIINRVTLGKMQPEMLQKALTQMGAESILTRSGSVSFALRGTRCRIVNGELVTSISPYQAAGRSISPIATTGALADEIKRAYSAETVKMAAAKNGWRLQQTGPYRFKVQR